MYYLNILHRSGVYITSDTFGYYIKDGQTKCAVCNVDLDFGSYRHKPTSYTKEHVIPKNNGCMIRDIYTCKRCNNGYGKFDQHIGDINNHLSSLSMLKSIYIICYRHNILINKFKVLHHDKIIGQSYLIPMQKIIIESLKHDFKVGKTRDICEYLHNIIKYDTDLDSDDCYLAYVNSIDDINAIYMNNNGIWCGYSINDLRKCCDEFNI